MEKPYFCKQIAKNILHEKGSGIEGNSKKQGNKGLEEKMQKHTYSIQMC